MHSRAFSVPAFVAVWLLLSTANLGAQVAPPVVGMPTAGMRPAGIMVTASGIVNATATTAAFSLFFTSRGAMPQLTAQALAPVIDADGERKRQESNRTASAQRACERRRRSGVAAERHDRKCGCGSHE
ncbi:MAG: hypothetical protein ACXWNZ_14440 [Vulcanimicrobiaceae bacterium]